MSAGAPDTSAPVPDGTPPPPRAELRGPGAGHDSLNALEAAVLGPPRYTRAEVSRLAGAPEDEGRRLWRAMGFPDAGDDDVLFGDLDVQLLSGAHALVAEGILDEPVLLALTRAIGQAESRVAESQVQVIMQRLRELADAGGLGADEVAPMVAEASRELVPAIERYVVYGWRRHLVAAMARELTAEADPGDAVNLVVGFADLVGFTAFSQEADERAITEVVDRFEDVAYDRIAEGGGRVVKMIGDEVMFAVSDPAAGVEVGLDLADAYAADERVPDVRVGLACGPILARAGDLLGPSVNLASRLVNIARPGTVLISADLAEALADRPGLSVHGFRRPRSLKGIGRVPVFRVRRSH